MFVLRVVLILFLFSSCFTAFSQDDKLTDKDSTNSSKVKTLKSVTVPAGTKFSILINNQLATHKSFEGSTFSAALASDFLLDTLVISPKNSLVMGKIIESKRGQGLGDAKLTIQIIEITVNNKLVEVVTNPVSVKGEHKRNAEAEIPAGTIQEISLKSELIIK